MSLVRGGWRVADQAMIHPAGCFAQRTRLWPAPKFLRRGTVQNGEQGSKLQGRALAI
jgi:hypothetical protein